MRCCSLAAFAVFAFFTVLLRVRGVLIGDAAVLWGDSCVCVSRKQAYWSDPETLECLTAVGGFGAGTAWMPFAAAMRRCSLAAFAVFIPFHIRFVRAIAIV
jgi:hypothetical protein